MITGELPITVGDIFVDDASVSKNIEKVHKNIGYWLK
jgi:ABC-type multidrug transport system ATPase subunit